MSQIIAAYGILSAASSFTNETAEKELIAKVCDHLDQGWELQGGITAHTAQGVFYVAQAIVKYEGEE